METWKFQDAKAKLSEVFNRAHSEGPQMVSRHGKIAGVILDIQDYEKLAKKEPEEDLVTFLLNSPLRGLDPALFEREQDYGREVEL